MATLIKRVQGFVRGQQTAGANGLMLIQDCVDHMFEHNDWTPLAWLINKSSGSDASRIRAIVGEVAGGVKLQTKSKQAKAQPSGMFITMGDNAGPTEKMPILRNLVEEGKSFRSNDVRKELLGKEPPAFDIARLAKNVSNTLKKNDKTFKDLLQALEPAQPKH